LTLRIGGQFLPGPAGPLAVVLVQPSHDVATRFAALYVPPFGDEMNKARRMVALQARAFAVRGGAVAILDLRGTGDSGGDHAQATWEGWHADVSFAWDWLSHLVPAACVLWGLRTGGLLAAESVARRAISPSALLLWQPVVSGRSFFNQLLRLPKAQTLSGPGEGGADSKALRSALSAGRPIEVGGYDIHPELVAGAEAVALEAAQIPDIAIIWRETSIAIPAAVSPTATRLSTRWADSGASIDIAAVSGPSFWATQTITEAPELIADTTATMERHMHRQALS
jgi:exosortase A-associated hydrolase 2